MGRFSVILYHKQNITFNCFIHILAGHMICSSILYFLSLFLYDIERCFNGPSKFMLEIFFEGLLEPSTYYHWCWCGNDDRGLFWFCGTCICLDIDSLFFLAHDFHQKGNRISLAFIKWLSVVHRQWGENRQVDSWVVWGLTCIGSGSMLFWDLCDPANFP